MKKIGETTILKNRNTGFRLVFSQQNSPVPFERNRITSFMDDKPKADFKKIFNILYQDTGIGSGTRK